MSRSRSRSRSRDRSDNYSQENISGPSGDDGDVAASQDIGGFNVYIANLDFHVSLSSTNIKYNNFQWQ